MYPWLSLVIEDVSDAETAVYLHYDIIETALK
jgi:hypothetical protein